jgi:hypothetical protein
MDEILRSICIEYCFRACPFVSTHERPPIFKVEYMNSVQGWRLTWFYPDPTSQTLLVGVPKTIMSPCGVQYNISVVAVHETNKIPYGSEEDYEDLINYSDGGDTKRQYKDEK